MNKILIVGAGLSGSLIAFRLMEAGKKITLIDHGKNASSMVAAGQINPVTFRRMNLGWRTHECFEELESLYPRLEQLTGSRFFDALTIRRFFAHQQEVDLWEEKSKEADCRKHLAPIDETDKAYPSKHNTFGTGKILSGAVIRPKIFLPALHDYLDKQSVHLRTETFDYQKFEAENRRYNQETYAQVIFCTGFQNFENPLFDFLPVQCTKGQILHLSIPNLSNVEALNRKCFLIPKREGGWLAGSTYEWNQPNTETTPEAQQTIENNLNQLIEHPFAIQNQNAGVRPTTPDRRPIIGEHPNHQGVYIFNGLGTKGYSLAPLLTKEFVAHLLDGQDLPHEVSLHRFKPQKLT